MLDELAKIWRESLRRRELRLNKKAEAPELYRIMLNGRQPIQWLLDTGRISHVAYCLALDWLKKEYLCERLPPDIIMYEQQGYELWLEMTVKGRRRLKLRYGYE